MPPGPRLAPKIQRVRRIAQPTVSARTRGRIAPGGSRSFPARQPVYSGAMTPEQIARSLSDRFGGRILASFPADKHPRVHVDASDWLEISEYLHGEHSMNI